MHGILSTPIGYSPIACSAASDIYYIHRIGHIDYITVKITLYKSRITIIGIRNEGAQTGGIAGICIEATKREKNTKRSGRVCLRQEG
jgi:hypothetical protein